MCLPDLGGSAAAVVGAGAGEASGFVEDGQGAVDLAGFLIAAEEVADFAAGDAVGAVFGESPDLVGGRVAERVAGDPAGGVEAVAPDSERRFEVRQTDLLAGVEGGVDRGEADDVRFGAAGGGAEQAFLAAGQRALDLDPALSGVWLEGELAGVAGEPQRSERGVVNAFELFVVESSAERELLASPDRDE